MANKTYPELNAENLPIIHFLKQIPARSRILEFGPAVGYTTRYLKEKKHCQITCIELNPEMAKIAAQYSEKMIIADIDTGEWESQVSGIFDYIIFGDVLEHLRTPANTLQKAVIFLSPKGYILTSIPNIAHNAVVMSMTKGIFEYTPFGLLDNTHVYFFTRKSMTEMFENTGLKCIEESSILKRPGETELKQCYCNQPFLAMMLLWRTDAHVYQFVCKWGNSIEHPAEIKASKKGYKFPAYKLPLLMYFDFKDYLYKRFGIRFRLLPPKKQVLNGN